MPRKKKKSYNPFKMWGSYVGLVLYSFFIFISMLSGINIETRGANGNIFTLPLLIKDMLCDGSGGVGCVAGSILSFILTPILGFLLGWGIHSIFRVFKKK